MAANKNFNQFDEILNEAGKKLGISPDALRAAISDPNKAQEMMSEIDRKTNGKYNASNIQAMQKMMNNNPNAKKMFDNLTRGDKNG